jgi:hypothetical protein
MPRASFSPPPHQTIKWHPMNLTDEIKKLADLRQQGQLTDQEFSDAKRKLLAQDSARQPPNTGERASDDVSRIAEKTFQSSRWSASNLFFPDRISLSSDGILFRKGALFGSTEEHIDYRAVASFKITNGIFLAQISIETSGGSQPIFVNGLWKSDAKEIQDTIRVFQRAV